jgi:outer membrane protein
MIASLLLATILAAPEAGAAEGPNPLSASRRVPVALTADLDLDAVLRDSQLGKRLAPVPGGLTTAAVAERAAMVSPSLQLKQNAIERAAAKVDQAIVGFLPQVGVKAGYTRLSKAAINFGGGAGVGALNGPADGQAFAPITVGACPGGVGECVLDPMGQPLIITPPFKIQVPLNSYSLSASISVPISDYILSLAPARKGTLAARDAAVLARDAERVKVQTDARLAYYNWLRAVASLLVIEDSLQRTESRLVDVQHLFDAGSATRSDVLRVDALVSAQQAAIADAVAFRRVAERGLAVMMNEPLRAYEVGDDILAPPRDIGEVGDLDRLIAEAHGQRLELRSLEKALVGTREGIRATRAQYYPRLDAFADAVYANPNQRFFPQQQVWRGSWSVGVQFSYTINQSVRTKAQVREQKTNQRDLVLQAEMMRRAIAMEVAQAFHDRERAMAAVELSTRSLASAIEAYRVASENYRLGAATTNEIIDAEGQQVQAALHAVNSHIDLHVATTRLLYSTGRLNPKAS